MRLKLHFGLLLPFGLLATAGIGVQYVNVIFSSNVRWLVLLLIFAGLFEKRWLFAGLKGRTALLAILFLLYAVLTTAWSDIPLLSGPKSFLQLVSSLAYFAIAVFWIRHAEKNDALNFLWTIVGLAIVAAAAGTAVAGSSLNMSADVVLYRGLSYNPNFLGMLLLTALPLPLWHSVRSDISRRRRRIAIGVLLFLIIMLLQTISRASILSASVILLFFFWGRGATKLAAIFALGILAAGLVTLIAPQILDDLSLKFIQKGQTDETAFYSREFLFAESLEAARAGGALGLGHGVSFGFSDYSFGQGSAQYGREKGNITLAMIEELGWVGLLLFVGMLLSIILSLGSAIRTAVSREERTILFLVLGTILALLVHAQFEAWLLAPGAAATPVFWALVGVASELSKRIRNEARDRRMYLYKSSHSNSHSGQLPALGI